MDPIRAVIYCRCSTEEESQVEALKNQVRESEACVLARRWQLVDRYVESKSGTTTKGRDEYMRLYEDLLTDRFDMIVIKSQDRLMRNVKDWYLFLDRMQTHGKRLYIYLERKFYTTDDSLITGIKAILAEDYSRELSKKINHAHQNRQRNGGKAMLNSRTFGYRKMPDGSVAVEEEEAEIVREIFAYCIAGYGTRSIANIYHDRGYRKKTGTGFCSNSVRRIIRNPLYMGTMVMNRRHYDFETKREIRLPPEEWIYGTGLVPAIVTAEVWEKANSLMTARAGKYCRGGRDSKGGRELRSGGDSGNGSEPQSGSEPRNECEPGNGSKSRNGRELRNGCDLKNGCESRNGSESRNSCDSRSGNDPGNGCNLGNGNESGSVSWGKYALTGKLVCAECGRPYYRVQRHRSGRNEQPVIEWKCSTYLSKGRKRSESGEPACGNGEKLPTGCDNIHLDERILFSMLEEVCGAYYDNQDKEDIIGRAVSLLRRTLEEKADIGDPAGAEAEEARLRARKDLLLSKLLDGVISDQDYQRRNRRIERKLRDIQTEKNFQTEKDAPVRREPETRDPKQRIEKIRLYLENGGAEKAAAEQMLQDIQKIVVHEWQLEICFDSRKIPNISEEQKKQTALEEDPPAGPAVWMDYPFPPETERGRYLDRKRIMEILKERPELTVKKISEQLGEPLSMVRNRFEELRSGGYIRFDGRGGHGMWRILKDLPDKAAGRAAGGL